MTSQLDPVVHAHSSATSVTVSAQTIGGQNNTSMITEIVKFRVGIVILLAIDLIRICKSILS
jgi:hypothetical protein